MAMIYLAADHRGYERKEEIKHWLASRKVDFEDVGNTKLDPDDDEVDFVKKAAGRIGDFDQGIFFCGSGVMVDIAANRFPHLRAGLAISSQQVAAGRRDDNINVLCIATDFLTADQTKGAIEVFLATPFSKEERFIRRIGKLDHMADR